MICDSCNLYSVNTEGGICGVCMQIKCIQLEQKENAKADKYLPKDLKEIRGRLGWTQETLAIKKKIPLNQIRAFEQGKDRASPRIVSFLEKIGRLKDEAKKEK